MTEQLREALLAAWRDCPEEYRSSPATEEELSAFESEFGRLPPEHREYLAVCGGGIGAAPEWLDNIAELRNTYQHCQKGLAQGWLTMADVFVIGWDGCGNPFGIERASGRILVEDHDFGGVHEMASSFVALLWSGLRRYLPPDGVSD